MINSFIDMVNESNLNKNGLVDEMGVKRVNRLTGSEMGTIRQQTIRRREQMADVPPVRSHAQVESELEQAFKIVNRTQITFESVPSTDASEPGIFHYPRLPQAIIDLINELKEKDEDYVVRNFGRWRDVYPSFEKAIRFRTEPPPYQRSHFPNDGVPNNLRGIGLGYKLYRALLKHAGYISSNRSGSNEKDKAWGSMLEYKANPDGSPSVDDCHSIIGPSNWMAIDKTTLSDNDKVDVAQLFIIHKIGFSNTQSGRFDMDDELLAIMPDEFLTKLHPSYLDELVNEDRLSPERKEQMVAASAEAERLKREQAARAAAEIRAIHAARITQYGVDLDADWAVGDYIVVKSYLYTVDFRSLPIRKVVKEANGYYTAVTISDAIRIWNGEVSASEVGDTRTTDIKSSWVKVNLEDIPDLTRVNLSDDEQTYIQNEIDGLNVSTPADQPAQSTIRKPLPASQTTSTQGNEPDPDRSRGLPTSGADLKRMVEARESLPNIDLLKKIRKKDFVKFMVLNESQRLLIRSAFGVPVYAPFVQDGRAIRPIDSVRDFLALPNRYAKLVNVVTGQVLDAPFTGGNGYYAYELEKVSENDKMEARAGDRYYIANHMNNWGIFASCAYTTRNTINQPFIYLNTFGFSKRPTSVRLDLLRKVSGQPIEL
jgi:hypothetical protein